LQNMSGLLHFCGGDLDRAGEAFNRALALDRQATIDRGWYIHFLFAKGQEEEALRLLSLLAGERVSNAQIQAIHGLYLNKAKRYEEAARAFALALALDRNCWPAHYGLAQAYLATAEQEKAAEHLERLEALVEPQEYEEMKRRLNLLP
jgi:tetratricopeptide (TPR) repeat protein